MDRVLIDLSLSSTWFWLILGCLIILVELLGATAGYFLWIGAAAICVSIFVWVFPTLYFESLLIIFVCLSLLFSLGWCLWTRSRQYKRTNNSLNNRKHAYIGMNTVVIETFRGGIGRIKIADGSYSAQSDYPLQVGDEVVITGFNDIYLFVKPYKDNQN